MDWRNDGRTAEEGGCVSLLLPMTAGYDSHTPNFKVSNL